MTLADAVLEWYAREARDLPWRRTRDPYAILVSEVMLQQTQVARVVPRYVAWLERWPDGRGARRRAGRPTCWPRGSGWATTRRALRLREACAVVARDGWPDDLRTLPGIGPYTAAAVGAFAFGRHELPVDTNVRRVLERTGFDPGDAPSPDAGAGADGAGRGRVPRAGRGVRVVPGGVVAARPRTPSSSPRAGRAGPDRASASRTRTAGFAAGSWRPWPPARRCPTGSSWSAWSGRSSRSCGTGWCAGTRTGSAFRPDRYCSRHGPGPSEHREARLPHRPPRLRARGGRRAPGAHRRRGR